MVTLHFKPLEKGQFSAYLDMYHKDSAGKKNRKYEFSQIKVSKDYSQKGTRVKEIDRDNLELAEALKRVGKLKSTGSRVNFVVTKRQMYDRTDFYGLCKGWRIEIGAVSSSVSWLYLANIQLMLQRIHSNNQT